MRARRAERGFAQQLRQIARAVGDIVRGRFDPLDLQASTIAIGEMLSGYADLITPWARAVAYRLLADISRRDAAGWHRLGQQINRALVQEIETTPMQQMLHDLLETQVDLIRSIPLDARERVHELSVRAMTGGGRWEEIAEQTLNQYGVSRSKANLIARTETGRAQTEFQRVRAEHIGSEGYIWRTARDLDVRALHRRLEGTTRPSPVSAANGLIRAASTTAAAGASRSSPARPCSSAHCRATGHSSRHCVNGVTRHRRAD